MILLWLLLIPLLAAPLAWGLSRLLPSFARCIAIAALLLDGGLLFSLWMTSAQPTGPWIQELSLPWIPAIGSRFHLAVDGISLALVTLTVFLGLVAIVGSWKTINDKVGLFHAMVLWLLTGVIGVFLAIDLFLFYFAWELMLIPTYFLIALWGSEYCQQAASKFFLFTQLGGLFLLAALLALYCIHGQNTGSYTFDYPELIKTALSPTAAAWILLGFAFAFFVKLPIFPFHTWLPDAYSEAPTAGSLILAGLLAKTGAYGLIRFIIPLCPQSAINLAPVAWTLGIASILYGAGMAFAQTDLKRLIAYSSLSHMGFVLIGIFSGSPLALQGALIIMLAHGISISGLFLMAGELQTRLGTRDIAHMGGLWTNLPTLGGVALFFTLATLGLPGLGNFVGEFLVLLGMYSVNVPTAVIAALGLILSVIYSVWMIQRVFYGNPGTRHVAPDLSAREICLSGIMMVALLWLGLFPAPFFNVLSPAVKTLIAVSEAGGM
jgi:NADH-quinone oxidoreductase subunit M